MRKLFERKFPPFTDTIRFETTFAEESEHLSAHYQDKRLGESSTERKGPPYHPRSWSRRKKGSGLPSRRVVAVFMNTEGSLGMNTGGTILDAL